MVFAAFSNRNWTTLLGKASRCHSEVVSHSGSHSSEHLPDLVLCLGCGLYRFAWFGGTAFQTLDLAVDLVQSLVDDTCLREYLFGGDHLRFGVSIAVRVLGLFQCAAVGLLHVAFPHDV